VERSGINSIPYPHVAFDGRDLVLGGFDASKLAARDMQEFYPDLIVFHVHGDHRAYERIIRSSEFFAERPQRI